VYDDLKNEIKRKFNLLKKQPSLSRPPLGNDNEEVSNPSIVNDVIMGIRFYSQIPIKHFDHQRPQLKSMTRVLVLVSIIIALAPALVLFAAVWLGLPLLLAALFGVATQIAIVGAMAEDGLADSFDGLFGGSSKEQRLEIMIDSTHGTFGVVAIVLLIGSKIIALGSLTSTSAIAAVLLWISAQIIARQSALWLVVKLPSAKNEGTAAQAGELSGKIFWLGMAPSALVAIIFSVFLVGVSGIIITAAIVVLIIVLWTTICKNLVGGYSGDLIGGLQAMLEIGILSGFLLFIV